MKLQLIFLFVLQIAVAQIPAQPDSKLKIQADAFYGFDNFGFAYYGFENALIKEKEGQKSQYQNLALGKISRVDLQNPLNLVLHYANFNAVVLLYNKLK